MRGPTGCVGAVVRIDEVPQRVPASSLSERHLDTDFGPMGRIQDEGEPHRGTSAEHQVWNTEVSLDGRKTMSCRPPVTTVLNSCHDLLGRWGPGWHQLLATRTAARAILCSCLVDVR